jgi:hypothetical protein
LLSDVRIRLRELLKRRLGWMASFRPRAAQQEACRPGSRR